MNLLQNCLKKSSIISQQKNIKKRTRSNIGIFTQPPEHLFNLTHVSEHKKEIKKRKRRQINLKEESLLKEEDFDWILHTDGNQFSKQWTMDAD